MPYPHDSPQAQVAKSSPHLNSATRFAKAFSDAQSITLNRARIGLLWPLFEFWKDRLEEPMKIVHELIDPIVADAVAKRKADLGKENVEEAEKRTLLEELASSTDGMSNPLPPEYLNSYHLSNVDPILLRDEIMSLLVAGRDTVRKHNILQTLPFTFNFFLDSQHSHFCGLHAC